MPRSLPLASFSMQEPPCGDYLKALSSTADAVLDQLVGLVLMASVAIVHRSPSAQVPLSLIRVFSGLC